MTTQKLRIVPHLNSSQALVFPIMEYTLDEADTVTIGRSVAEKRVTKSQMTFRSKVVSRKHAEIFLEAGKVYLRDVKSSSGTFLNSRRLCGPGQVSQAHEIQDNDIIQLGVDYQEIYRCVRMRLELNRESPDNVASRKFNLKTYHSLRNLTTPPNHQMILDEEIDEIHVDECCICLFAIAPFQALFVAPCSHTFHYKCLRPLLANHPGFNCPLCRAYADLDASVSVEVEEVSRFKL
ncbi:SMAD/FHA domain-containing protein [Mucor mucedo]|uniref:SMAD/FHA domain-containing protein n=1 Tax=Mucor mucedo TaxID=29922 RepID=UPI00221F2AF9|nr:SMAD/FHA domain-containing protein [Mucor mucedo]KAI7894207.1 SMAD/FHA domain-containing protein [Mucor mucedo]